MLLNISSRVTESRRQQGRIIKVFTLGRHRDCLENWWLTSALRDEMSLLCSPEGTYIECELHSRPVARHWYEEFKASKVRGTDQQYEKCIRKVQFSVMKPSHVHPCCSPRNPRWNHGMPVRVRGDGIHVRVSIFFLINVKFLRFLLNTDLFPTTTCSLHRLIHRSIHSMTPPHVLLPLPSHT